MPRFAPQIDDPSTNDVNAADEPLNEETEKLHNPQVESINGNKSEKSAKQIGTVEKKALCKFYVYKKCKHGPKGKGCSYEHPTKCFKFMRNGTNAKRGCTKGKNCTYFHPPLCRASFKTGICANEGCHFHHIKGTKLAGEENEVTHGGRRHDANTHQNNRRVALTRVDEVKAPTQPRMHVLQRPSYANVVTMDDVSPRQVTPSTEQMDNSQNFLELNRQIHQMQLQINQILKMNLGQQTGTKVCRCPAMCQ